MGSTCPLCPKCGLESANEPLSIIYALDDKGLRAWDLTFNEETQRQHARVVVRNMLWMTSCRKFPGS